MKVATAWICLQCEEIFAGQGSCPACGGARIFAIARWLNRTELPEPGPPAIEQRNGVMFSTLREVEA